MSIKKFIDLKSKTKYTSQKKKSTIKLPIVKKKEKKDQLTYFIQNKQSCPLKNSKQK